MPSTETGESSKSDCTVTTVGGPDRVPEASVISQSRLSASDLETLAEIRAELDCLDSGATEMADGSSQAAESEELASTSEAVLEGNPTADSEEVPGRVPAVVRRGPTLTARDVHCSTPSVVVIQRPGRVTSSTSGSYVTSSVRSVVATPAPTTTKRAASGNCGPVIAKVIITGNPNSGQSRPIVSMGSRTESAPSTQHVKIVGSGQSGVTTLLASPTKAITLAQAQQMGLLSPAKVQQILPRATVKQTHDTGTVLTTTASTGQMIRIPATQNVVTTTSSNVHQIQVPGRQLQYVRLVNASEGTARVTTASTPITPSTTAPTIRTQPSLRVVPIAPATEENRGARRVAQPSQRPQQRSGSNQESARPRSSSTPRPGQPQPRPSLEPNGIRPKKPCNCTKSQCLKLYCDCFANGEFCHLCNCANCSNNLEHEEERQRAIKSCLERNPNAFRPKIGKGHVGDERRHNKGCNCKRSGCLKNYCECYEAKIPCSGMCKCVGCRNVEESPSEKKTLRDLAEAAEVRVRQQAAVKSRLSAQVREVMHPGPILGRKPRALLTTAVIEATCQCMLAQAKGVHSRYGNVSLSKIQESVIKEFGKCLIRIVESAEGADSR